MHIVILGAGVIGVTTAYELAFDKNPHKVSVFDIGAEAAQEASRVNASMIAPGHAYAWASPKVPKILLKSIYRNDQAFRIRFSLDREFWKWTALFLKQCNDRDARENSLRKHTLCRYSQKRLGKIVDRHGIQYDRVTKGLLYLFRDQSSMKAGVEHSSLLSGNGQRFEVLEPQQVVDLDAAYQPALSKIAGAIYSPTDETGSCQKFTKAIVQLCEDKGVRFHFGRKIQSLKVERGKVQCAVTSDGEIEADLYIVSLGAQSPLLLSPAGVDLPIYPVKGYSLTLPVNESSLPPTIGSVDEDHLVACAPMGDSVRVTATAEFAGYDLSYKPKDFRPMVTAVQGLMPNAANYDQPMYSACFRPMTPQGTPYIGFTKIENLFVNSGQGHMGWTMACGSAKLAANLISGETPAIDVGAFSPIM